MSIKKNIKLYFGQKIASETKEIEQPLWMPKASDTKNDIWLNVAWYFVASLMIIFVLLTFNTPPELATLVSRLYEKYEVGDAIINSLIELQKIL